MWDLLADALIDTLKMLPFLFVTYLLIEYLEHRASAKLQNRLASMGRFGALGGAVLGCVPQCGFSVAAARLFSGKVITAGTLAAVFIATSDEAVPIFLAHPGQGRLLLLLLLCKILLGVGAGLLLDFVLKDFIGQPVIAQAENHHEHCHDRGGSDGIWLGALKKTVQIFLFILVISVLLNLVIAWVGEERLSALLMSNTLFQPFVAGLVGFIPNCAPSILLTELFLNGSIHFGSLVAGLSTGAGMGLLVLFRSNRNLKQNFKILCYIYLVSVLFGMVLQLLG